MMIGRPVTQGHLGWRARLALRSAADTLSALGARAILPFVPMPSLQVLTNNLLSTPSPSLRWPNPGVTVLSCIIVTQVVETWLLRRALVRAVEARRHEDAIELQLALVR